MHLPESSPTRVIDSDQGEWILSPGARFPLSIIGRSDHMRRRFRNESSGQTRCRSTPYPPGMRRIFAPATAITLALALTACGSDKPAQPAPSPTEPQAAGYCPQLVSPGKTVSFK